jgi:alanyl aminopeptidase
MEGHMPKSTAVRRQVRSLLLTAITILPLTSSVLARLGQDVIPVRETITLRIDADTPEYSGSVSIDLQVQMATASFQLHAEEMQLTTTHLTGPQGETKVSFEVGHHGLVTFIAESELAPGDYRLEIEFTNDFNSDAVGLYRVIENENGYLFTQFEEDDAREAFPCFDEPGFKIPFQMTLVVPEAHLALANTPIESESTAHGWRTVVFAETKPLPTYLLAISTGLLETVEIPGMKHLTSLAVKMTPPLLSALEEYFGRPYPYRKLDLIAVPEFWAGAMENAGAITFRETALAVDEATATLSTKRRMAIIIAHELAHMWFGDLVTMEWWDDLWLNEAFASWMESKITNEVFPEFNVPISVVRSTQRVMSHDARKSTSPIRQETMDEENLLANIGIIYSKGEAVLGMFEKWLGEEPFRDGVRRYINENEWGFRISSLQFPVLIFRSRPERSHVNLHTAAWCSAGDY